MKYNIRFFIILGLFPVLADAQSSFLREKKILIRSDSVLIDTLSIIPKSFKILSIEGVAVDSSSYKVDFPESRIVFKDRSEFKDSVTMRYQTFPFLFSKEVKHKDVSLIHSDFYSKPELFSYNPSKSAKNDVFKTDGLEKSGSISRGISFGNNQDLNVNSNLNLQLAGKLNNNIDILMSATDNNIPIQPDGNTQQLQEFDKVFIQLSDDKSKLIAGDFQLLRPRSYFMNYNKRGQGLNFATSFPFDGAKKANKNRISASGAVSKGKFARNIIKGLENNQGPYRLKGSENETFIIVLSGTEKVYIDGSLLQRGQENDYVIDYNTAEVRFTPKNLITKDKRIIVEFQYSDKNYARSLVQLADELDFDKLKLSFNLYSEQDAKNQPLQQQLSLEQKAVLAGVGDSIQQAVVLSIDSIDYTNSLVLYRKKDTLGYKDVYEYSNDPNEAFFKLNFSFVGDGNGNYTPINIGTNGKVFKWIAPVAGKKQGAYEPAILLVSPQKRQMLSISADYELSRESKINIETAVSNYDINTFSKKDKSNDDGSAFKLNYDYLKRLSKKQDSISFWQLKPILNYEFVSKNFSSIERFRLVEFERDWNRANTIITNNQHIFGGGLSLIKNKEFTLGYLLNSFVEEKNYKGLKHNLNAKYKKHDLSFTADGSILYTKSESVNTSFSRSIAQISKKIKWLNLGVWEQQEDNQFRNNKTDSLLLSSYKFYEWEAFAGNSDSSKVKIGIKYKQRTDFATKKNSLNKSTFAENLGLTFDVLGNPNSELRTTITYRTLKIIDTTITQQKPDNTVLSRVEYNFNLLRGLLVSGTFLEFGSGLEAKKDFVFIEVAPGQGTYFWSEETDYNKNGIKELNEFEVALFPGQGNYLKVYIPTSDYIKTYSNELSEVINIKPSAIWNSKTGFKKLISRFANQMAYKTDRKTTNNVLAEAYNPFLQETKDPLLVSLNTSFRNTVFFNQLSPYFGADYTYQDNRNKSLLTYGNDSRVNTFSESRIRWNMTQKFSLNISYKFGNKYSNSEYLNRNFDIDYFEALPKINYQPNAVFRCGISFRHAKKENKPDYGNQQALIKDYGGEMKYNILQKGSLNIKANFIQIDYSDIENSSLGFEMLEGLHGGNNITWNVSYQRNLSNNTQLSLNYDGRKSETSKTIHTGGVQVRAYFQ